MKEDPIAFFITWTCYGTWLPGDDRGWMRWHRGEQLPQPLLADWCRDQMVENAIVLDDQQREIVKAVVREHCDRREWILHAAECRTNHCHVVLSAPGYDGEQVRDQLKSWGTRRLKDREREIGVKNRCLRENWWTRKGSVRYLFNDDSLAAAIEYVRETQDSGGSKANR